MPCCNFRCVVIFVTSGGCKQKRTTCTQQAIRIDVAEGAVVSEYAKIRLTAEQASEVRDFVLEEMAKLRTHTQSERDRLEWRLKALRNEQQKLIDAHYADAIPLDLLKTGSRKQRDGVQKV
jgi:site-specific DNA recombinase